MKLSIQAGATSQSINIFISDSSSTTGAGLAGLAYNTSSLVAYYTFAGANATSAAITLATLAAVNSAYSSGGFKEIDATNMKGWYRLDLPNAVLATSKGRVVSLLLSGAANMAPCPVEIELTGWDNQDAVRGGMTALPNAAAAASGGLIIQGSTNAAGVNQGITVFGGVLRYNSTSHIVDVFIADSRYTDGRGLTGLAYNTPSLVAYYSNEVQGNAGATAISLVTATLGTFSSGGFKEKDSANQPGVYELHLPNAAISSSGNRHLVVTLSGAANMATTRVIFTQVAMGIDNLTTPANVTQWSSTNVASPDTAGYPKVTLKGGTGAGELSLSSGVAQADIAKCGGSTVAAGAIPNVAAGSTGGLILIGTGARDINPNAGGVVITATGMDDVAAHVWDLAYASHNTSGTFGYQVQNIATGTPPTAAAIASQVRTELTTELGRIDVATSTRLAPTTAGRTLDVSTTGEAGLDFDNIKDASGAHTLTNITIPTVTTAVNVTNNNDKTGYTLIQAFPTNFSTFAIDGSGYVTVGTNSDKTGYALTSPYDPAKTAAQAGDEMAIADGSISDSSFTEPAIGAHALATGPLGRILQSWRVDHYKEKFEAATGDLTRYAADGTTVLLVLPCTDVGGVQTRGAAS